jgi:methionyl-tRNA formyltransferase
VRLVFFGTPRFAVPTLETLLAGPHDVVAVVSQPDRPRGRGRALQASPVSELALEQGVALLRPERVAEAIDALAAHAPDLGVVVAFGQFLPRRVRELPRLGYCINGHASLLPRHRGAAPIARAILAGDAQTGVSIMRVEREMDAGPVALSKSLRIGEDETTGELTERLAALTARAIAEAVNGIASGPVAWTPQDEALATTAPKLDADDARIDWNEGAAAIARRVRAMAPKPGARTEWEGVQLRILAAHSEPGPTDRAPGTVQRTAEGGLRVATGDGWLAPLRLQRAGGRALDLEAFLRGRPIGDAARLGGSAGVARLGE